MERCEEFLVKWDKKRKKGRVHYIFNSEIILDFLIGLPIFLIGAPFVRSGFSTSHIQNYASMPILIRDVLMYTLFILFLRVIYRFGTWCYKENKYNDIIEK